MEEDYSNVVTKKDLVEYRERLLGHLKNTQIDYENFKQLLVLTDKRIAAFKDEVDQIVNEVSDA